MATPKPGEIRCPTCHRSTPPAAFCTQCGSAIPPDARARPRGMDRDELQDRIRARRSGGEPYRRGSDADEGTGIYERFEPDPTDSMAKSAPSGVEPRTDYFDDAAAPPPPAPPAPRPDLTRDRDDWDAAPAAAAGASAGAAMPPAGADQPPAPQWTEAPQPPAAADGPVPTEPDEPYAYDYDWEEEPRERSGALAIMGFLGLGVLALLAGAVLASLWGGGVGQSDATPTPIVSEAPASIAATPSASASSGPSSAEPSASAEPSGGPITFPDGFVAEAQPCIPGSVGSSGCDSNGVSNAGAVDIWVGFQNGNSSDVIGAIVEAPDGTTADQSIDLARIGCGASCNGYTWFSFSNLDPGTYEVRITRNGQPASSTSFEVT